MLKRWIERQNARYHEAACSARPSLGVRLAAARRGSPSVGVSRVIVGVLMLGLCLVDVASRLADGTGFINKVSLAGFVVAGLLFILDGLLILRRRRELHRG